VKTRTPGWWRARRGATAAFVGLLTAASVVAPVQTATSQTVLSGPSFVLRWTAGPFTQDTGNPIAESSPVVANLDGSGPAVVVGDRTGYLYALHLADGSPVTGWPASDQGVPIDSTPSVAPLGGSSLDSVFVGAGNAQRPNVGGYMAYGPNGQLLWHTPVTDPASDGRPVAGVQASITVANLEGSTDVFAGSLDQESYALNAANGAPLPGWPFFTADSVFSTAAVGDLYGTGQQELVVGGASSVGYALGLNYAEGGHVRVLNAQGRQIYDYDTNQEVDSSPAIGDFLAGGATGIVVGTGSFYPGASDTDTLKAFSTRLGPPLWSVTLDGLTKSSPALANVEGGTQLYVVEGTDAGTSGSVWVLNGATGATVWHQPVVGRVIGSVVAADLTGAGYQDLLVPTVHGVEVLDGRTGAEVTVLGRALGFQNSPLVTDDPNGTVGITIAGYNGSNQGVVQHYEIPGSDGALAVGQGSWPMFHHDPQSTGASSVLPDLGRVTPTALVATPGNGQVTLSWSAPPATGSGAVTGYNIYESTAPGHEPTTPVNGTTPVTGTSYTAAGLADGTRYYFEVTALNASGEGAPSNEAGAVPAGTPGAPASVAATAGPAQVSLSWAAPSVTGGSAISGYNVYLSTTAGLQGTELAQVTGTSYTATGLADGTTYYLEVTAVNANGEGPPSVQVIAVPVPSSPPTSASAPGPPNRLVATAGNAQVTLSWAAPSVTGGSAISGYNVYLSPTAGLQGTKLAEVTGTGYTATGLADGTTYYFEVTAVNAAGEGVASAQVAAAPAPPGYRVAGSDGQVFALGKLASLASPHPPSPAVSPTVGIASTPDAGGYWLALKGGGVLRAGDARLYGSMGGKHLNSPIAGIAATPDGHGYWLVAADGGIFNFGDARYYGSLGRRPLNQPIAGIAATPDGHGYWLVAADGGIFAFGDARFYGSMGARHLNQRIVAITATRDGRGYWLVASDGGIFAFGDAVFHGSMGSRRLNQPIVGMAATPDGRGYWMVAGDGGVFGFGNAAFFGSLGHKALHIKVVGIAS
jgi:Fibronectin type III domain